MDDDLNTGLVVLQTRLESMLDQARQNSAAWRKFQAFEIRLLKLNSLAEMIDLLLEHARDYFDLEWVSLCVVDEKGDIAKYLNEDGYHTDSKRSLILLDSKNKLLVNFGLGMQPYIGQYKPAKHEEYFRDFENQPASVAICPLNRRDKYLGTLNLGSSHADRFADSMATDFVEHLALIVGICLENNLNFETIKRTSFIDSVTGINNRRFFEQRIVEEVERCKRTSEPISCLFLDIDFFKVVNDKQGHQAGDKVLFDVAAAIKTQLRSNDVLARYGGEEFVMLLSNTHAAMVRQIAERVRRTIESLTIHWDGAAISVTASIGCSTYSPDPVMVRSEKDIAGKLIKTADAALYQAKRNGRNRVESGGLINEEACFRQLSASNF